MVYNEWKSNHVPLNNIPAIVLISAITLYHNTKEKEQFNFF
jgi:hypothetical protein